MREPRLFTLQNPKSVTSEAFRTLRTNIQFTNIDKSMEAIVISSSGAGEGKTTTSCNLAISLAQSEKSVLLVDCDLRKPRVHKNFNISNLEGLTNILMGEQSLEEVIFQGNDYMESLTIVPSGPIPPNPSELVGSSRMKRFLNDVKTKYDMIILDSPPLNLVTDAAVLSTLADGTILVIDSGKTQIQAAVDAKEQLDKVRANLIGVVLNRIDLRADSYYGYNDDVKKKRKSRRKR